MKNSHDTIREWNQRTFIYFTYIYIYIYIKKSRNFITGLEIPLGFQEVEVPKFQDNRHMKVVRLSALHTGLLHPTGNIPGTYFC